MAEHVRKCNDCTVSTLEGLLDGKAGRRKQMERFITDSGSRKL